MMTGATYDDSNAGATTARYGAGIARYGAGIAGIAQGIAGIAQGIAGIAQAWHDTQRMATKPRTRRELQG